MVSQDIKRGHVWTVGYSPPVTFNFSNNNVGVDTLEKYGPSLTFGSSNICDTNGKLQFFCNGFHVYDSRGWPLEWDLGVFDTLNCPLGTKFRNYYNGDGFWNQMSIILPKKDNQYYVFTTGMSDAAYDDWKGTQTDFRFDVLSYHIVDMDANAGAGKIVSKNNILMKDARLSHNRMTAVRHANGRDWWLIKPHQTKQIFYTFRVTSDSIFGPFEQKSNFNMDTMFMQAGIYGLQGQLTASPDGNWIASSEAGYKGVFVYRFDRCSGQFSDYHFYQQASFDSAVFDYSVATCFSPNNKLLYLVTGENIWQCELEDTSKGSVQFITGRDTTFGFPEYNLSYLAPNGFIYIGAYHGIRNSMPFIENPDVRGLGCNFRGRGNGAFSQPYTNLNVPPNLPFYGLGKLEGSPCDTIKPYVEPPPITTSQILVPDAFSPNGDGKNDTWHILNLPQLQLSGINIQAVGVYNRWGNEVFKSSDINFAWDAKGWLSDTYYYYILYRNKAGTSQVQKGSVSVVR